MRRQWGILGLFIGLATILVFWLIPVEKKSAGTFGNTSALEALFYIFVALWILFSLSVKLAMVLKKRKTLLNFCALLLFYSFIVARDFLPPKNMAMEFHLWHDFSGLIFIYGWTLIDAIDLTMIYLSEKW